MNKPRLKIVILLCLIGIALASILTVQHYRLLDRGFEEKSFCSINEWIDCDAVNASSYSSLFSLPVSGLGLLYYLVVLLYAFLSLKSAPPKKEGLIFCFLLSAGALVFSLYMAYISLFVLELLCLLCAGIILSVLLIFLLLPPAMGGRWRDIFSESGRYLSQSRLWRDAGTAAVIYLLGFFVLFNVGKAMGGNVTGDDRARAIKVFFAQMPVSVNPGTRPFWGTPGAPVTIVEFSDFQCPFCRIAATNIKPNLAEYKKEAVFYFANYPLDSSCNPNVTRAMHSHACTAAKAVLCAEREGKFWTYHDEVFKNQKKLSREMLLQIAESQGMNKDAFSQCLESEEINARVQEDIELGRQLGVRGTPAVFINGRPFPAWRDREALRMVIEEELKRKEK